MEFLTALLRTALIVCSECRKEVPAAATQVVVEPIHRDGPTYYGMATSKERRVCTDCL